MEANRRRRARP